MDRSRSSTVRDGSLFIAMSGGCQGCAASKVTLRQGFEVRVRGVAPEIENIVDTTNHAAAAVAGLLMAWNKAQKAMQ